jgi:CMP-N-acetylneuraminic acid synthetase
MFLHDYVYAIIPARGGSKGLPGKNLMKLGDKSLLERAVDSAKDCLFVDITVVSSDDAEILAEAHRLNVVNHRRADAAATDESTAAGVIIDFFENAEIEIDPSIDPWIVYLQPTSPMRTSEMVEQVFELLAANPEAKSVVSVSRPTKSPYWSLVVEDGKLKPLFPEAYSANRQSLAESFLPNGAIYCFKLSEFKKQNKFPFEGALPFVMSEADSVDIDTQADFDRAKAILEK